MISVLIKFIKWSLIASVALALVGVVASLVMKIPVLQGAYVAVMIGAVVPMMGAIFTFASPRVRMKYMAQEIDEKSKGAESLPFAVSGFLMMGIAFFLEAMMH